MVQDRWTGSIVFAATDRGKQNACVDSFSITHAPHHTIDYAAMAGLNNSMILELNDALLTDSTCE
jgi:hypothetical protein